MRKNFIIIASHYSSLVNLRKDLIISLDDKYNLMLVSDFKGMDKDELNSIHKIQINFKKKKYSLLFDLFLILKLSKIIKNNNADIVMSYNYKPTVYASLLSIFFSKIRFYTIITGLGYAFASNSFQRLLLRFISIITYIITLQKVKKIFVQNIDDFNFFLKLPIYNVKNKLINLNSSGINLKKYVHVETHNSTLSFLFASRLVKDKGIIEFIKAANLIKKKYKSIKFFISGRFDYDSPSFISEKNFHKLNNNTCEYLGNINNIEILSKYCSVFVLPTYREGCPNIALEMGLMSKPIITTFVPGCKNLIKNNYSGYFVVKKDVIDLYNKIEKFILDEKIIKEYGNNSKNHIIKNHSLKKVNDCILNEIL